MRARGYSDEVIQSICEAIEPFAGYGFNRSHAAAYAFVACQTAYFKARYPLEFFTSLLTVNANVASKVVKYIEDARKHGFTVLPPDINKSQRGYTIEDDKTIRMGLESVNGLGPVVIEKIVENQPYANLSDFALRTDKECKKKTNLEHLAMSGIFNSFYPASVNQMEILSDAFVAKGDAANAKDCSLKVQDFTHIDRLEMEKKYLGFYFSGHPLDGIGEEVDLNVPDNQKVRGKAILSDLKEIMTKKGEPMAFIDLSFVNDSIPACLFPRQYCEDFQFQKEYTTLRNLLKPGMIVDVVGKFQYNFQRDERSFIVDSIKVPIRVNEKFWKEPVKS